MAKSKENAPEKKVYKEHEPEKTLTDKPVKTITLNIVLEWLLGSFILAIAYENLIHGMYSVGALVLIAALAILPLTNLLLRRYLHVELSGGVRTFIVIASIVAIGYIAVQQPSYFLGPRESGVTDEDGRVIIDIGDSAVPFILRDQTTGIPLEGINAALGIDPSEPWHAILVLQDPAGQYPLKLVELQGALGGQTAVIKPSAADGLVGAVTGETAPIEIIFPEGDFPYLRGAVDQKGVSGLQDPTGLPPGVNDLTKALPSALQKLPGWAGIHATTTRVDATDMSRQIVQDYTEGMSSDASGWVTTMIRGGSPVPGMLGEFTNSLSEIVFSKMGATEYDIVEIGAGPMSFKVYKPIFPSDTGPVFPPNPESSEVSVTTPDGAPVSGGSLQLMSKNILGEGFVGVLDSQGRASIPVPIGDYTASALTPGNSPGRFDLPIKATGGSIAIKVQPSNVARIELYTQPALSSRMSLPEGTTRKIAMIVYDSKGKELTAKQKAVMRCTYFVHNPVGKQVASVNRDGTVTIQGDAGAASVVARCNGVLSKPLLISGSGERAKEPAKPPVTPYAPDVPDTPTNLPPGFPTNLPIGDYSLSVKVCATMIGCISQQAGIMHNQDPAEFANAITNAMNQWMRSMQQGDCHASVSYSQFNGQSFSAKGVGACVQGNQRADVNVQFILQKV